MEGIICLEPKTELKIESTKNALKESFPDGSVAENLPTKQETWVQFLGQEDPLEKEMATNSSIIAWEIQGTEEPGGLQSVGWQRVGHN